MARPLDLVADWPVRTATAAIVRIGPDGATVLDTTGPTDLVVRLASISKPMTAWATLVAAEEGIVALADDVGSDDDQPDDGPRRTLRHALAHAAGFGFDSDGPILRPERKRVYSNTGFDVIGDTVATAAEMPFADYLRLAVFEPLGMTASVLRGSPAHAVWSTVEDVVAFMAEVVSPRLVTAPSAAEAVRPHWPSLGGIVPGVGRFETCPWGLGFEIRGDKTPHWTGARNSAATYGHFGGSGTMMWIDPVAGAGGAADHALGLVALTDRRFDEWAAEALVEWPRLSDAVIEEYAGSSPG